MIILLVVSAIFLAPATRAQDTNVIYEPYSFLTFAGNPRAGYQDGPPEKARFVHIKAMCTDARGNLYAADASRIRKIAPDGFVTTLAGGMERGHMDGIGASARFEDILNIVADGTGDLYIVDYDYADQVRRLRKINADRVVSTLNWPPNWGTLTVDQEGKFYTISSNKVLQVSLSGDFIREMAPLPVLDSLSGIAADPNGDI